MSPEAWLVAIELIALTKLDGRIAYVNPSAIVQLAEPHGEESEFKQFTDDVKCVVVMTGRSYITVRETCDEVRKLFVRKEAPP